MGNFLPVCKADMIERGWDEPDFVYVIGDAYVDHPSFGPAIISRVLESNGYKVGIISQPDWKDENSICILGKPRLGFIVSGGNMDSMVNHYTSSKKRRNMDAYTPKGEIGKRPDRATIVYSNLIRKAYKGIPVIIGGIEASLRRMGHYDYWSDAVKRSILLDSQANILSYGMGERSIVEIADALNSGIEIKDITFIRGTVYKAKDLESVYDYQILPEFASIMEDKEEFAKSFQIQYENTDFVTGKCLVEPYKEGEFVVQNPPAQPLTSDELDVIYGLPYMRDYHPSYKEMGGIPAVAEIKFSLISSRGCFGGCSFCALTFHQGRVVQARSHESLLEEAKNMTNDKDFKGYIHDVGGPTANFRKPSCKKQEKYGVCKNKQCLFPKACDRLEADHDNYLNLLKKLREIPKVKKVFIKSGIRFDYLLKDRNRTFLKELCQYHVSGQLKVAPEHISKVVLDAMGKPNNQVYEEFIREYKKVNQEMGMEQYVVPYLMSSHPGSTIREAVELAEYVRDMGYMPEQVQDFYPTPGTISTCMYHTGIDPRTMKKIFVPKSYREKSMQRALIQYRDPKNYDLVKEALLLAGRQDLIGNSPKCLIKEQKYWGHTKNKNKKLDMESKRKKSSGNASSSKNGKAVKNDNRKFNKTDGSKLNKTENGKFNKMDGSKFNKSERGKSGKADGGRPEQKILNKKLDKKSGTATSRRNKKNKM